MTPPIQVTSRRGRLSDVRSRTDWSMVREQVDAIKEGEMRELDCPDGVEMATFRCIVLTYGARRHTGKMRLSTRTSGRSLQCFLVERR